MILYEELFKALDANKIEYLVAGGFAVNFYQVQRATADLDIILHLEKQNIEKFIHLMGSLGYQPRLPVRAIDFADESIRKDWIRSKNMTVFTFYNPKLKFETIDIFVEEPKPFKDLYSKRMSIEAFGAKISVLGLEDLIEIKTKAGRDKDLFDVQQLKKVHQKNG